MGGHGSVGGGVWEPLVGSTRGGDRDRGKGQGSEKNVFLSKIYFFVVVLKQKNIEFKSVGLSTVGEGRVSGFQKGIQNTFDGEIFMKFQKNIQKYEKY